jgi:hypothetical protein
MWRAGRRGAAIALAATVMGWVAAEIAAAQPWGRPVAPPYASRRIRCESAHGRSNYCPTNTWGRVLIERRLSRVRCRENFNWGADRDGGGVWVADGCRAIFVITPYGGPGYVPGHRPHHPAHFTVTCKSKGFKPNYCPFPRWGRVRLERRLSDSPCIEYHTWGADGGGIWVDRGCAAVFSVR